MPSPLPTALGPAGRLFPSGLHVPSPAWLRLPGTPPKVNSHSAPGGLFPVHSPNLGKAPPPQGSFSQTELAAPICFARPVFPWVCFPSNLNPSGMPTDPAEGTAAPHHGASEASGVLKPSGTAGTIWAQVQGLQDTIAVQEALPCGSERGGHWGKGGVIRMPGRQRPVPGGPAEAGVPRWTFLCRSEGWLTGPGSRC